ncbi:hypothetical protein LZ30DRAFT_243081 [Colletotrichum cereale]|nr:hypothetical protein LZ30DRAFT_243081 [Colletotrichum cereale]
MQCNPNASFLLLSLPRRHLHFTWPESATGQENPVMTQHSGTRLASLVQSRHVPEQQQAGEGHHHHHHQHQNGSPSIERQSSQCQKKEDGQAPKRASSTIHRGARTSKVGTWPDPPSSPTVVSRFAAHCFFRAQY